MGLTTQITAEGSTQLDGMTIHAVWAKPPNGAPDDGIAAPDVQHLGYVLDAGGIRVYFSGDPINTFSEHDELLKPITALRPNLGILTTHPTEGEFPFFAGSIKSALKLALQAAIPAHYDCFVKRTFDPQEWAGLFPEEGPEPVVIPYNQSVVYPR